MLGLLHGIVKLMKNNKKITSGIDSAVTEDSFVITMAGPT